MKKINSYMVFQRQPGRKEGLPTRDEPAVYEFLILQSLSDHWASSFDGLDLICDDQGHTLLRGIIVDQAALFGVLNKIRDFNLTLLSVVRI